MNEHISGFKARDVFIHEWWEPVVGNLSRDQFHSDTKNMPSHARSLGALIWTELVGGKDEIKT